LWQQEHAHKNLTLGAQDLNMKQVYSHEAQEYVGSWLGAQGMPEHTTS